MMFLRYSAWAWAIWSVSIALASGQEAQEAVKATSEFQSLFDGESLSGWDGDPRLWSVLNGTIRGETTPENVAKGNTFLIWNGGIVKDFELRLKFRCSATNNSGVQYRSQRIVDNSAPNRWRVRGYQHELRNELMFPNVAGFIYDEGGNRKRLCLVGEKAEWTSEGKRVIDTFLNEAGFRKIFKLDDWNDVVILATGNRIRHVMNGQLILDFIDLDESLVKYEGVLALQLHDGKPMWVEFKDIRLRDLAPAEPSDKVSR